MRRASLLVLTTALAVVALLLPAAAKAIDGSTLRARLSGHSERLGASSGAYVYDIDAGAELYARRADLRLAPASNEKLYTTAGALLRFGANGTLTTTVATKAEPDDAGRLAGDLYLIGGGDPSLGDVTMRALAAQVTATGLKRVTGRVRGDESGFDRLRGSFDSGFRADGDIGGQLGALTWGHGSASPGGPATVAAARLQKLLKARGVRFGKRASTGDAGADATSLASIGSPPMSTLIRTTNQPSDNFYAEMLVKATALEHGNGLGTTAAGLTLIRDTLREELGGVRPTLRDGSGLSRADRTSPREVVTMLRAMHRNAAANVYKASLAAPGGPGTLRHRMRGTAATRCRAKTGTLRGVSALSGYCTAANGHTLAYSFIENQVYAAGAKSVENRMLPQVAAYSAG